ncbi:unnamed protein product, partial [Coregonus sp. 'balchen']
MLNRLPHLKRRSLKMGTQHGSLTDCYFNLDKTINGSPAYLWTTETCACGFQKVPPENMAEGTPSTGSSQHCKRPSRQCLCTLHSRHSDQLDSA